MLRRQVLPLVALVMVALLLLGACSTQPAETPSPEQQPEAPEGKELAIIIDTEKDRELEAQAIKAQLEAIGVRAEVRTWEWTTLLENIKQGSRQMYLTDWGSSFFDPYDLGAPKLMTEDRGNFSFYSNPQFDELMTQAITTVDTETRREAYYQAQEILKEDAPWVFGYYMKSVEAARQRVQNWAPSMDSRENMHDVTVSDGDTVTIGLNTDAILAVDPASSYRDRETETVIRNMFDGLVTRTRDGKVVPELAESWEVSEDGTTYTFTLRQGVKFHNGEDLTADDVVFTFQKILGLGDFTEPTSRAGLIQPAGVDVNVEKVDDYTVRFTFSKPFPVFLQGLVHQQVVPMDYYLQVGEEGFKEAPVGAGPFRWESGRWDDQIVLKRFEDYYGGSPDLPPVGPARIETLIFRLIPEPNTMVVALKNGEIDIATRIPVDLIPQLEADPEIQVKEVDGTRNYGIELNNGAPPFDDVRVRQALNYAIDWDTILQQIYGGLAERLPTAFLPSGFGYNPDVKPYPYDPAKAVELLQAAGYRAHLPE